MNDEELRNFIVSRSKNLESGFKNVFKFRRKKILGGN
jgi:hypothetical protein